MVLWHNSFSFVCDADDSAWYLVNNCPGSEGQGCPCFRIFQSVDANIQENLSQPYWIGFHKELVGDIDIVLRAALV